MIHFMVNAATAKIKGKADKYIGCKPPTKNLATPSKSTISAAKYINKGLNPITARG